MRFRIVGSLVVAQLWLSFEASAQVPSGAAFPAESQPPSASPPSSTQAAPPPATEAPLPAENAEPPSAPPPPASNISDPPPPPARENDARPIRARRPFFIGGELGWNGLSGLGANFSYHPIPYLAFDTGLGLSLTGGRLGVRARYNVLLGDWTPFFGAGFSYAGGSNKPIEFRDQGESCHLKVLPSPFFQLAAGVNYTGREGFVFMATTGYSLLLDKPNTRYVDGSSDVYDRFKVIYRGGLIVSVAFGYAF